MWAVPLAIIGLAVPLAILAASFVLVDAYADVPGSADDVESRVVFGPLPDGVVLDDSPGEILFVTVSTPHFNALQQTLASFDGDVGDVRTYEELFGTDTPGQQREISLQMMRDAKDVAAYVAFTRLGLDADLESGPAVVERVVCLNGKPQNDPECDTVSPAGEFLERGATITSIDGTPTPTLEDIRPIMAKHQPGDVVTVGFRPPREDAEREVRIATIPSTKDPTQAIIGFIPHDTASVVLPFEAGIDTNRIGGPSAGLAFTLTLIDQLSPGSLTGGRTVGVTGTISDDGSVGAIGGILQKVVAIKQAGGDYFIVPLAQGEEQIAELRRVAGPDLEIVPVSTLEEALTALAARGGTPIRPAPVPVVASG